MTTATDYDPQLSVRTARAKYFADNAFGDDGGYSDNWVILAKLGPIPLGFPNTPGRRRAVRMHDLHHLATGYRTDFVGEAEIAAWELGGGCGSFTAAWVLNTLALPIGALRAPARTRSAWARGARSRTLYEAPFDEAMLDEPLASLRERLGCGPRAERTPVPTPAERRRYRLFVALGLLGQVLLITLGLAVLAAIGYGLWSLLG
jgi:hypothetical protein